MNIFFIFFEIKYLKMVMQQMKYLGDLKAECILDRENDKCNITLKWKDETGDIHEIPCYITNSSYGTKD